MTETRRIIICADDFPLDHSVRDAALELASLERISAISCMTETKLWRATGKELAQLPARIGVGLHFNVTEQLGSNRRSLPEWILRALTGAIDAQQIRTSLQRQWDNFCAVVGRPPDYIDGHQHVHILPGIATILDEFLQDKSPGRMIPTRGLTQFFGRTDAPVKRLVIRTLAKRSFRSNRPNQQRLNTAFGGDYSLSPQADYPELFSNWISAAPDGGLIMCHPANQRVQNQPHTESRLNEYRYLRSGACGELIAAEHIELVGCALEPSHK